MQQALQHLVFFPSLQGPFFLSCLSDFHTWCQIPTMLNHFFICAAKAAISVLQVFLSHDLHLQWKRFVFKNLAKIKQTSAILLSTTTNTGVECFSFFLCKVALDLLMCDGLSCVSCKPSLRSCSHMDHHLTGNNRHNPKIFLLPAGSSCEFWLCLFNVQILCPKCRFVQNYWCVWEDQTNL